MGMYWMIKRKKRKRKLKKKSMWLSRVWLVGVLGLKIRCKGVTV
jgi:hypothetical protein